MFHHAPHGWHRATPPSPPPPAPSITYPGIGSSIIEGQAVEWTPVNAGGGSGDWEIVSGALPGGLTINPANGVISGTVADTAYENGPGYSWTARATNDGGSSNAAGSTTAVNVLAVGGSELRTLPGDLAGELKIEFIAPEDPGTGAVKAYDVRIQRHRITPENVALAPAYSQSWTPATPDATETKIVAGTEGQPRYLAIRPQYQDDSYGAWFMGAWGVQGTFKRAATPTPSSPTYLDQATIDAYFVANPSATHYPLPATADVVLTEDLEFDHNGIGFTQANQRLFGAGFRINANLGLHDGTYLVHKWGLSGTGVSGTKAYDLEVEEGEHGSSFTIEATIAVYSGSATYRLFRHNQTISTTAQGSIEATIDDLVSQLTLSANDAWTPITWTREGSGDTSRLRGVYNTPGVSWKLNVDGAGGAQPWATIACVNHGDYTDAIINVRFMRGCTGTTYSLEGHGLYMVDQAFDIGYSTFRALGTYGNRHAGWCGVQIYGNSLVAGEKHLHHVTVESVHGGVRCRLSGTSDEYYYFSNLLIQRTTDSGGTNGYGLMLHGRYQRWFDSKVVGNIRGVHADGTDAFGKDGQVEDIHLDLGPEFNDEYGGDGEYDIHGIKHEFASGVHWRRIFAEATTQQSGYGQQGAHGLDISGWNGYAIKGLEISVFDAATTYRVTRGGVSYETSGQADEAATIADLVAQVEADNDPAWLGSGALNGVSIEYAYRPYPYEYWAYYFSGAFFLWNIPELAVTFEAIGGTGEWFSGALRNLSDGPAGSGTAGSTWQKCCFRQISPSGASQPAIGLFFTFTPGTDDDRAILDNVFLTSSQRIRAGDFWNYARSPNYVIGPNHFEYLPGGNADGGAGYFFGGYVSAEGLTVEEPSGDTDWSTLTAYGAESGPPAIEVPFSLHEAYRAVILVTTDGTTPLAGATVTVRNVNTDEEFTGDTDANGILSGITRRRTMHRPTYPGAYQPTAVTDYNDFEVEVVAGGYSTYTDDHTLAQGRVLVVNMGATSAAFNTATPDAPTDGVAKTTSPTSAYVAWTAPTIPGGISHYMVYVDGEPRMRTSEVSDCLFGLEPGTEHDGNVEVTAVGRNGVESAALVLPTFTTQAENRGAA